MSDYERLIEIARFLRHGEERIEDIESLVDEIQDILIRNDDDKMSTNDWCDGWDMQDALKQMATAYRRARLPLAVKGWEWFWRDYERCVNLLERSCDSLIRRSSE